VIALTVAMAGIAVAASTVLVGIIRALRDGKR
jgi:hypothetical protein